MIVIPMAGASRRFAEAGHDRPKYMLPARGHSLFHHAVASFRALFASESFLFIARDIAGTADFIANIHGLRVVGDLKSGRSVHTEAALQASALAHCHTLITPADEPTPAPRIDAGIVVHLTPNGYRIHQAQLHGEPWAMFAHLRRAWWSHARNTTAREPLFLSGALDVPADIRPEHMPKSSAT